MSQYTSLFEAASLAFQLNSQGIGDGVLPYNPETEHEQVEPDPNDAHRSGVYIPEYAGGSPVPTPADGQNKFYHFRFRNGAEGINAGLVRDAIAYSPVFWPQMIASSVNAAARVPVEKPLPPPIIPVQTKPSTQVLIDSVIGAWDPNRQGYEPAPGTNPTPGQRHDVNGQALVAKQVTPGFLGIIRWVPDVS